MLVHAGHTTRETEREGGGVGGVEGNGEGEKVSSRL